MKKLFLFLNLSLFLYANQLNASNPIYKTNDLEIIRISENVYMHVSYRTTEKWGSIGANGLIYINNNKAFILDTPWNNKQTENLVSYIEDSMKIAVVGFIPTHWHDDCIGGLDHIKSKKIKSYGNQLTIKISKEKNLPLLDKGFKDSLALQLGEKEIKCYFPGAAHSLDNIVIWLPSEKILFAGCTLKGLSYKSLGFTDDGDLKAYPETLKNILNKFSNAKIVIPGHGEIGGVEIIKHNIKLANQ